MENFEIYSDIASRTNGDVYVGVVGPVRTGKSTFIKKFMEGLVLGAMKDKNERERAKDEMPQSGAGKTIMTMQPKFVPNEAVKISLDSAEVNVRLVDCVGYLVDGVSGHTENGAPRMVKTPWAEQDIPFEKAAEIGTHKVIAEHSTIGIVVTTDGTITELPRISYVTAEERVVRELKSHNKPFVVVLNSANPKAESTEKLRASLEAKYMVPVLALNVANLNKNEINEILKTILSEFPVQKINVEIPDFLRTLPSDNEIVASILTEVSAVSEKVKRMRDSNALLNIFSKSEDFLPASVKTIKFGTGEIDIQIAATPGLFYKVLSRECETEIQSDFQLMSYVRQLSVARKEYERLKDALESVEKTGYGIVMPTESEMTLEVPEIIKRGSNSGVRLKASASSLHIMKVDVQTEVVPAVGSAWQTEELGKYLLNEFENNPEGIWQTNMFGKSLSDLVREGINGKLQTLPEEAQVKMRKTLGKIVNEGKGGIICILL